MEPISWSDATRIGQATHSHTFVLLKCGQVHPLLLGLVDRIAITAGALLPCNLTIVVRAILGLPGSEGILRGGAVRGVALE